MNFLCISNYNNDLDWVGDYPNPHLIYDKTWNGGISDNTESSKSIPPTDLINKYPNYNIVNGDPNGYNISDYMTFIIDNYDNLPDVTVFIKGNIFPRHISKEYFDRIVDNKIFTPIEDWTEHSVDGSNDYTMFSCEGGWMEKNDSWYLKLPNHPVKYFTDYNTFINFCYKNPVLPKYLRFPPGGNYIVPKDYILRYEKVFYQNLKKIVNHHRVSGEGQMIERSLFTIWTCNFEVSDNMKKLIN